MLKNLSFIAVAGLLATGCVIDLGNTTSATATTTESTSAGSTSGGSTTSAGTTSGATTTDGSATGSGTEPTTGPTTGATTSTSGTTSTTSAGSTGGAEYGKCGWNATEKFYACEQSGGGMPGAVDPDGISPIDCPDMLPAEGDKCDETTPVNNVGCCLPDGTNWYCSSEGMVVMEACGA